MPEYTADFTSNVNNWVETIISGLNRLENQLRSTGSNINSIQLGSALGQSLVENLQRAGNEALAEASRISNQIQDRLRVAKSVATGGGSVSSAFAAEGGTGVGGDVSGEMRALAQRGLQNIVTVLNEALSQLPPELALLKPELQAIAAESARTYLAAFREAETGATSSLRATLGSGAGAEGSTLAGRSTLVGAGNRFIAGSLGSDLSGNLTALTEQVAANLEADAQATQQMSAADRRSAAAAEREAIRREQFAAINSGTLSAVGGGASPRFATDAQGSIFQIGSRDPITAEGNPEAHYQATKALEAQQTRQARAAAAAAPEPSLGPGAAFLGGLTSRGYEAPGTGLVSLFGTAGVLTRYSAAGAGIGALFASVEQLKTGIIDVNESMSELDIAQKNAGGSAVDLTAAWGPLAQSGVDLNSAISVGANALVVYQDEIRNSNDATRVFNDTVQQSAVLATNAGIEIQKAGQYLQQATLGFQLGSAGQSRVNDAISNAVANFGGGKQGAADIAQAVSASADVAREGGVSPEQAANILALVRSRTGLTGSSLASGLDRLVSRSGNQQFTQALSIQGIGNTGNVVSEIEQLSAAYKAMDASSRAAFENQLGGARSIQFLIPLLEEGTSLGEANSKSLDGQGKAADDFSHRINNLGGELKVVGAEVKDLFQLVGNSGLFAGFGIALATLKPTLEVLNAMLATFNSLPSAIRDGVGALLDFVIAYKVITGLKTNALNFIPGVHGRRAAGEAVAETAGAGAPAAAGGEAAAGEVAAGGTAIARAEGEVAAQQASLAAIMQAENERLLEHYESEIAMLEEATGEERLAREEQILALKDGAISIRTAMQEAAGEIAAAGAAAGEEIGAGGAAGGTAAVAGGLFGTRLGRPGTFLGRNIGPRYLAGDLAGGISSFAERRTLGGAVGAIGGIGSAILPYGLAALAGYGAYNAFSGSINRQRNAANAGVDVLGRDTSNDPNDLRTAAANLTDASKNIAKASGGAIGTITGGLGEALGYGVNRGQLRNELQKRADADKAEADAIDKVTKSAESLGNLDYSSLDNLSKSIQNLSDQGVGAVQIVDDLTRNLQHMNQVAATGQETLLPGQSSVVATKAGGGIVSGFENDLSDYLKVSNNDIGTNIPLARSVGAARQLAGIDQKGLQKNLTDDIQKELDKQGYSAGKPIDTKALETWAQADLRTRLKQIGIDYAKLPANVQSALDASAKVAIAQSIQSTTGGRAGPTALNVEGFVKNLIAQGQAYSTQSATQFQAQTYRGANGGNFAIGSSLNDFTSSTTFGLQDLAGIQQQAHTALQQTIKNLQSEQARNPTKARATEIQQDQQQLATLGLQIQQTQQQLSGSIVSDLQAQGQFAVSAISPLDKSGRIAQQIKTLQAEIKVASPDQQPGLQASLADLQNQRLDQQLADLQAANDASVDPRDDLGQKKAALADAYAALVQGVQRGASGQDLSNLVKNAKAAETSFVQGQVATANALNTAASGGSSDLANAATSIQNAQNSLNSDLPYTLQWAQDLIALHQAQDQYSGLLETAFSNADKLGEDLTDPVVVAQQAVKDAYRKLLDDIARGKDSSVTNADEVNVQQAVSAHQKAAFDQQLSDAQTNYQLHRTSASQYIGYLEKLRSSITGTTRQAIDERNQIDQAIQNANASLEGQFNLGDIKVPTVYQVRRAVASAQAGVGISQNTITNITINGLDSTQAIVQVVRQQLGTNATVTRTPVTLPRT